MKFHHEINILKSILYKNNYPRDFVDKCIKNFLDRVLTQKIVVSTVPKKDLMIVLPSRVSKYKLINFFTIKDKSPIFLRSGIIYKFKCGGCSATYYGKTKSDFKVRMSEHLGASALPGIRVKGDNNSSIKEHHLFCNHSSGFDHFFILVSNSNDFKVTLMESLLINRNHSHLNKNRLSLPLELFDD